MTHRSQQQHLYTPWKLHVFFEEQLLILTPPKSIVPFIWLRTFVNRHCWQTDKNSSIIFSRFSYTLEFLFFCGWWADLAGSGTAPKCGLKEPLKLHPMMNLSDSSSPWSSYIWHLARSGSWLWVLVWGSVCYWGFTIYRGWWYRDWWDGGDTFWSRGHSLHTPSNYNYHWYRT